MVILRDYMPVWLYCVGMYFVSVLLNCIYVVISNYIIFFVWCCDIYFAGILSTLELKSIVKPLATLYNVAFVPIRVAQSSNSPDINLASRHLGG